MNVVLIRLQHSNINISTNSNKETSEILCYTHGRLQWHQPLDVNIIKPIVVYGNSWSSQWNLIELWRSKRRVYIKIAESVWVEHKGSSLGKQITTTCSSYRTTLKYIGNELNILNGSFNSLYCISRTTTVHVPCDM